MKIGIPILLLALALPASSQPSPSFRLEEQAFNAGGQPGRAAAQA